MNLIFSNDDNMFFTIWSSLAILVLSGKIPTIEPYISGASNLFLSVIHITNTRFN